MKSANGVLVVFLGVLAISCREKGDEPVKPAALPPSAPLPSGSGTPPPPAPAVCPATAKCIPVDANGKPGGTLTAQCSGRYPDFIDRVPDNYSGARFVLAQDYPTTLPQLGSMPWKGKAFRTAGGADEYMLAVRKYVYDGMVPADWIAQANTVEKWFHVPWMHVGSNPRELARGATNERSSFSSIEKAALGLKDDARLSNVAVGYYNSIGGYTIGKVWANPADPDEASAQFAEGTVVAKALFTTASCQEFVDDKCPFDDATPTWKVHLKRADNELTVVRLWQMDIAVKDADATPSGWIFGTFAYQKKWAGTGWEKMAPVGLMWGDDPQVTPDAGTISESMISPQAPEYASNHLGWAGRLNGPVDNPASSCLSCHGTAQTPVLAGILPAGACDEPSEKLIWFRNLKGNQPFGRVDANCKLTAAAGSVALDFSLQVNNSIKSITAQDDAGVLTYANPCPPASPESDGGAPQPAKKPVSAKLKSLYAGQGAYDTNR